MKYYSPLDFGAAADGMTDDGVAIQKAIDICASEGGGAVVLMSGKTYYSHSLQLRRSVELHIQRGAVLRASSDIDSYIRPCETINDPETALIGNPVTGKPSFAFIYAFEADGCAVTGDGVIDGNCYAFVERKSEYYVTGNFYPRPTMIYIEKSDHITVRDITLKNAPFWTLHPAGCNDVLISNIRILNPLDVANSDGIDPDSCKNVRIHGCHIECADDCICMKTTNGNREYGSCENIIISHCTLVSTSAAVKIGTEGVNDFKNIYVSDCIISKSNRGLSIQIRDGGNVENVSFSNICIETRRFCPDWWGSAEPISVTSFRRDENTVPGNISNVRFSDIVCKGENGVLVHGSMHSKIKNITFRNVSVTLEKSSKWERGVYDLRPGIDFGIIKRKTACFFIRAAENISFSNCEAKIDGDCEEFSGEYDIQETEQ